MMTFQSSPRASIDSSVKLPHVRHQDFTRPLRRTPFEVVLNEQLVFLGNPELSKQQLLDLEDLVASIVYCLCLLQDALRIHTCKLHGDRRVCGLVADLDLADFGCPPSAFS